MALSIALAALGALPAIAAELGGPGGDASMASRLARVLSLRDHNTRVVLSGVAALGMAAGVIGVFLLLRKRALLGDALSHATLPGIGLAFIAMALSGGDGKNLAGLLTGAAVFGAIGVLCVIAIRRWTRIKEDAALAIVLSVFFGLGVAVLGIVQKLGAGNAAGLESFIYGKTASMLARDAKLTALCAVLAVAACALLYKEFTLLCFDTEFAGAQGWPTLALDLTLMALAVVVTVIGLQAVGLILIVALLIIPAAAARYWTNHLGATLIIAGGIGAMSGLLGAAFSALAPRLPAGAIIVLTAAGIFGISMAFGRSRGMVVRAIERAGLTRAIGRQHLLRALYEIREPAGDAGPGATFEDLLERRSWSARQLRRFAAIARRDGLVHEGSDGRMRLTERGLEEARHEARNHRLWELYLIAYADVGPGRVDRAADRIEHAIGAEVTRELEQMLDREDAADTPPSPHQLGA